MTAKEVLNKWPIHGEAPTMVGYFDALEAMELYHSQQSADKDARIAELEYENEQLKGMLSDAGKEIKKYQP